MFAEISGRNKKLEKNGQFDPGCKAKMNSRTLLSFSYVVKLVPLLWKDIAAWFPKFPDGTLLFPPPLFISTHVTEQLLHTQHCAREW